EKLGQRDLIILIGLETELTTIEPIRQDRLIERADVERLREVLRISRAHGAHEVPVHPIEIVHPRNVSRTARFVYPAVSRVLRGLYLRGAEALERALHDRRHAVRRLAEPPVVADREPDDQRNDDPPHTTFPSFARRESRPADSRDDERLRDDRIRPHRSKSSFV